MLIQLAQKFLKVINSAAELWARNEELKQEIKLVSKNYQTFVGLPMASYFQQRVAMDLKQHNGKILIDLIDLATRLSAAAVIPNKNRETFIKKIFEMWISVCGKSREFLTENGGKFANAGFLEMAEQLGIDVKITAAESAWSNRVVEKHNFVIGDKIRADASINYDIAVAWAINAKNSLQNRNGFLPYQLAIGSNPQLPSILSDDFPALSFKPTYQIIKDNLQALPRAHEAFIASEDSTLNTYDKLLLIILEQLEKYLTGNNVYYKQAANRDQHGLAKVLGPHGQQVLLKHGSFYIRVHPCRLQICNKPVMNN